MEVLSRTEIEGKLHALSGWTYSGNKIVKNFTFKNFLEAIEFVNKAAAEAESLDHHPDCLIHSWNKVKIMISTHSAGGITLKDFQLAERIEQLLE